MRTPENIAREIVDWLKQNMDITSPTSCWKTEDQLEIKIVQAIKQDREDMKKAIIDILSKHDDVLAERLSESILSMGEDIGC